MYGEGTVNLTKECNYMNKKIFMAMVRSPVLWLAVSIVDFIGLKRFCVGINWSDDGSSAKYVELGYSYIIEGNFMPKDKFPGVTQWAYCLFGFEMETQVRD